MEDIWVSTSAWYSDKLSGVQTTLQPAIGIAAGVDTRGGGGGYRLGAPLMLLSSASSVV